MPKNLLRRISKISVTSLFGMFDYDLNTQVDEGNEIRNIVIFYGDNGSGKSTLLKLAFHMIAPDQGAGHKTYLLNTEFNTLIVRFNDGTEVRAKRENNSISGAYALSVKRPRNKIISANVTSSREKENDHVDLH